MNFKLRRAYYALSTIIVSALLTASFIVPEFNKLTYAAEDKTNQVKDDPIPKEEPDLKPKENHKEDDLNSNHAPKEDNEKPLEDKEEVVTVPFYSQFKDIESPKWQKVGCGIASVAMIIDYYSSSVSVESLLQKGIRNGAFLSNAGWTHQGLINLAKPYDLDGTTNSLSHLSMREATKKLKKVLKEGPVMASVHYTFEPTNPIPHLVVVNQIKDGKVYYNDPAENAGGGSIPLEKFQSAWKKRYIEIRPTS